MLSRRQFVLSSIASGAACALPGPAALANDLPPQLQKAQHQLYNFIRQIAQGEGLSGRQKLVLNSTIVPFDISHETPYYNEQVFRQYADRTFHGGIESLKEGSPASQAERFSSQYQAVLELAARQIDQNHPEINNSIAELKRQLTAATNDFNHKLLELDVLWNNLATSRRLQAGTADYDLQRAAWMAQIRFGDQIHRYSEDIDRINLAIDATRRRVYKASEMAVLDNAALLGRAYSINRPWNAQTERSWAANGTPLNDVMLADPTRLHPALFDASPLIMPIGDLRLFLSGAGERAFDTRTFSSETNSGTDSWTASGRGRFFGWSLGGGGSGSSSFSRSVTKLDSIAIKFENIADYFIDRSAWFNPAVLQDAEVQKLVKDRRELTNLQYVSVSLIIARGLTLDLKFSEAVNRQDWSQQSISGGGGASFLGFSFNASGARSSTRTNLSVNENGTNVLFKDGSNVARVLGVRVEPFLAGQVQPLAMESRIYDIAGRDRALNAKYQALLQGKGDYIELQRARIGGVITGVAK